MHTTPSSSAPRFISLLTGVLLFAASAQAYGSGEYWVDGPNDVQPGSDRSFSDVALTPDGVAVHVWDAFTSERNDIFVRRFNSSGAPLGNPQLVNTLTAGDQWFPRIAVRADGSFYVVWQSNEFDPDLDTNRNWVRGQLFDSDGTPQGSELLISEISSGTNTASVAALDNGGFLATWGSFRSFGSDSQPCELPVFLPGCDTPSVQARLISADGSAMGGQFQINEDVSSGQGHPSAVATADGGFVVFWESFSRNDGDPDSGSIQGLRFAANGSPVGDAFQVNTTTEGSQDSPEAALDDQNRILVVFESDDGNNTSVRARLYDPDLNAVGSDFLVPSLIIEDEQYEPRVAGGAGYFMAVWTVFDGVGTDPDFALNGRIVRNSDQFDGPQFQVNLFEPGSSTNPAVGAQGADAVASWRADFNGFDERDDGIVARRFVPDILFADGFE